MRASKVEVVVLGLLAEGPRHGYELLERLRERGMTHWVEVGRASVYQALRRLEERRLIAGRSEPGSEGPDRRVYRLTRAGRDHLAAGLRERLSSSGPYETGAGPALGFAHLLPPEEAREAIAGRQRTLRTRLAEIELERARVSAQDAPGSALAARLLELQAGLVETELSWLAGLRRTLGRLKGSARA